MNAKLFRLTTLVAATLLVACSVKQATSKGTGGGSTTTSKSTKTFLYVTNSTSDTISVFQLQESGGEPTLAPVQTFALGTSGAVAKPVIANADGSYLYVGYTNTGAGVKTFAIAKTGMLTAASSASAGLAVSSMAFSHDESLLFTGGGAYVDSYGIDIQGQLIHAQNTPSGTPVSTLLHPTLNLIYQADNSSGFNVIRRLAYHLEGDIANSYMDSSGADNPQFFAMNPKGTVAVAVHDGIVPVVFGTDSSIQSFTVDATSGALTAVTKMNSNNRAQSRPHHAIFHPTLDVFYVANTGDSNLATYTINATTGTFAQLGSPITTGSGPQFSAIDPSGRYLVVLNSGESSLSMFKLDATTGAPTAAATATVAVGNAPLGATFVRVPQ